MIDISKAIGVKRMGDWRPLAARKPTVLSSIPIMPYSGWTNYTIITDNQHNLPACAGFATANWIECMIRSKQSRNALKKGEQINGEAIWRKARKMFWAHEKEDDGGLFMDQGFKAAIALGILPPDTVVSMRDVNIAELSVILREQPVLQGTQVSVAWNNPSTVNGQIREAMPDPLGGHATCIIGVMEQGGNHYVLFQNSWGDRWGWNGYGLLTEEQWSSSLISQLATAELPWDFETWHGWRDFVVNK
jgi:hypothetical protein